MTSKKDKIPQVKGEEAEEVIRNYLTSQYRPFALNDIVQNLHNRVSKTVAQRALEKLSADQKIVTKIFGKVVIYACLEQELELDMNIDVERYTFQTQTELRTQLNELERDKNIVMESWNTYRKEPTNVELEDNIQFNKKRISELNDELLELNYSWDASNEGAIVQIIQAEEQLNKELKKRTRCLKRLISLIKDTVNPTNIAEFLVSFILKTFYQDCDSQHKILTMSRMI